MNLKVMKELEDYLRNDGAHCKSEPVCSLFGSIFII